MASRLVLSPPDQKALAVDIVLCSQTTLTEPLFTLFVDGQW